MYTCVSCGKEFDPMGLYLDICHDCNSKYSMYIQDRSFLLGKIQHLRSELRSAEADSVLPPSYLDSYCNDLVRRIKFHQELLLSARNRFYSI